MLGVVSVGSVFALVGLGIAIVLTRGSGTNQNSMPESPADRASIADKGNGRPFDRYTAALSKVIQHASDDDRNAYVRAKLAHDRDNSPANAKALLVAVDNAVANAAVADRREYQDAKAAWLASDKESTTDEGELPTPDWYKYRPKQGGFLVCFPKEPRELDMEAQGPFGPVTRHNVVHHFNPEKWSFQIAWLELPDAHKAINTPEQIVTQNLQDALDSAARVHSQRTLVRDGFPAAEVVITLRTGEMMKMQYVVARGKLITATAVGDQQLMSDKRTNQFFNSLWLDR